MDDPIGTYELNVEVKGKILAVRKIQDRGRIQIPRSIRDKLRLHEGESVYWVELNNRYYIAKAVNI